MVNTQYLPERGDIIWINFDPVLGHEQGGRRPALVISPKYHNERSGLIMVCPITSKEKFYPYEVKLLGEKISGAVLSDQIRTVDFFSRKIEFVEFASQETVDETISKILTLIE